MKILVINGPNLNMLGIREPAHYGRETYADLVNKIQAHCDSNGVDVTLFQSNHEGALIDEIQKANGVMDESLSLPEPIPIPVSQSLMPLNP